MKQAYEIRYFSEQIPRTKRYGMYTAIAALLVVPVFYYLDRTELGIEGSLPWRMVVVAGALLYLLGWLFRANPKAIVIFYAASLTLYLLSMTGLATMLYLAGDSTDEQQFAVTVGSIMTWIVITLTAQGARPYLKWVSLAFVFYYSLMILFMSPANVGYPVSLIVIGVFSFLLLRNQERQEREKAYYLYELEARENFITKQREELEEANANLVGFNYAITHDLKGPLRRAQSFAQLVERRLPLEEKKELSEFFGHINTNLYKISEIIDGLLLLSRIGKSAMKYELLDLYAEAERVWEEVLPPELAGKVEFSLHPLNTVEADPGLIWHVFNNFFGNAIKYSQYKESPKVEVGGYCEGNLYTFYVKDNGAGFPSHMADEIGRPFKRLHSAHDFEGTGIGMAIVRQIIELHQGHFRAEGEEGVGATFYCSLPMRRPDPVPEPDTLSSVEQK